jgi:phosphatidylglycerophosphatase A
MKILDRLTLLVATSFGLGYAPIASGTFGAVPGALLAFAVALGCTYSHVSMSAQVLGQAVFAVLLSALAIPICDVAERHFQTKDDGRIVADEALTFPVCTIGLPLTMVPWWMLGVFFVVNRVCDIIKPPPARKWQDLHGGLGIVADDFMACLYALAINWAIWLVYLVVLNRGSVG